MIRTGSPEDHGLALDAIQIDGGTQSRANVNDQVVNEYAEAIKAGATFPPIVIFYDGKKHWLADGFHRFHAYQKAGRTKVAADIRQGTRRDAILHSVGANETHGLRRTRDDKRRAVETLLNDPEWSKWSDGEIAKRCAVSREYVNRLRPKDTCDPVTGMERTFVHPKTGEPTTMKMRATAAPAPTQNAPEGPQLNDEPYPEAGPQAEASPAGTGTGTPADREGRHEGEAASVDLPTNLEAAWKHGYLIGFTSSAEGYNGEYPFGDDDIAPDSDPQWAEGRDLSFTANREAIASFISPSAAISADTVAVESQAPRPSATVPHFPGPQNPEVDDGRLHPSANVPSAQKASTSLDVGQDGPEPCTSNDEFAQQPVSATQVRNEAENVSGASVTNRWAAIRPHCLNPDCCAGSGSKHCHACLKARDEAIIAGEAGA